MWAGFTSYVAAMRDVLGLQLPEFEKYRHWETAAREGGFRVLHPEFCIVSDFPEVFKVDDQSRAHCENGPSHRWRDGWSLYHWHGISIPGEWVTGHPPTASEALNWPNIEQRHAACEIVGWAKILNELEAVVVDEDDDPEIGTLLQCSLPDSGAARFLRVTCGTKRQFVLPVPVEMKTAIEAQAWTWGLDNSKFFRPEVRT